MQSGIPGPMSESAPCMTFTFTIKADAYFPKAGTILGAPGRSRSDLPPGQDEAKSTTNANVQPEATFSSQQAQMLASLVPTIKTIIRFSLSCGTVIFMFFA